MWEIALRFAPGIPPGWALTPSPPRFPGKIPAITLRNGYDLHQNLKDGPFLEVTGSWSVEYRGTSLVRNSPPD
jgi:hypothetical protein